jgi:hypothetical protein
MADIESIFRPDHPDIKKSPNGDITIMPPAALAASQALLPPEARGGKELIAQVVINVPLGKLERFLKDVQAMLTEDEWRGPGAGLAP